MNVAHGYISPEEYATLSPSEQAWWFQTEYPGPWEYMRMMEPKKVTTHTITWKNYDGTTLETDTVAEGEVPQYDGPTPTRPSTPDYTYEFSGWNPTPVAATKDATYTAQYDAIVIQKFTIIWKNYDGTTLETDTVAEGEIPQYDGLIPTKPSTPDYTYEFSGWNPTPVAATKNATYTAQFDQIAKIKYSITWQNFDGSTLKVDEVYEGEVPQYTGAVPTRPSTIEYNYEFSGWSPTPSAATQDATYTAQFDQIEKNKYSITWQNYDGSTLEIDQVYEGEVPQYKGAVPTRPSTIEYNYEFSGWSPTPVAAAGDATYTAQYDAIEKVKYTITWQDYDGSTLEIDQVYEGVVPQYTGAVPTKPSTTDYRYEFIGWEPAPVAATKDASYTADYKEIAKDKHAITWQDYDGSIIGMDEVSDGVVPQYTGPAPTRPSTLEYDYEFIGWNPTPVAATKDATYTAQYDEIAKDKYSITWQNYDGSTLKVDEVFEGEVPQYTGPVPTRPSTSDYTYEFIGWNPTPVAATKDASYTADYKEIPIVKYTITWQNYDSSVLQTDLVAEGEIPKYTGQTPTRPSTSDYRYEFIGWNPTPAAATKDTTYTAQYDEIAKDKFVIRFTVDGSDYLREELTSGSEIIAPASDPTIPPTAEKTFDFVRWIGYTPGMIANSDMEFPAEFVEEYRYYTLSFTITDDPSYHIAPPSELVQCTSVYDLSEILDYLAVPSYNIIVKDGSSVIAGSLYTMPARDATLEFIYTTEKIVSVTITSGEHGKISYDGSMRTTLTIGLVEGTQWTSFGAILTFDDGTSVEAVPDAETSSYVYSFDSWSAPQGTADSDKTITASFKSEKKEEPKVTLDPTSAKMTVGDTLKINATVTPESLPDKKVTWSSSDPSVATVDNGTVRAISAGKAEITASSNGASAKCSITVSEAPVPPAVTEIVLSKTSVSGSPGESVTITATLLPSGSTGTVVWSSSDSKVATVSDGKITFVSEGKAVITASVGSVSSTCQVTVHAGSDGGNSTLLWIAIGVVAVIIAVAAIIFFKVRTS